MNIKFLSLSFTFSFLLSCAATQEMLNNVGSLGASADPTTTEITSALKQALEVGTKDGVSLLSQKDGFLGSSTLKILFPPEAQKLESTLRSIGAGSLCDKFILSLNRAAEDAASEAAPIFLSSIKSMSIQDGMNILLGDPGAATSYFKSNTQDQLNAAYAPMIQQYLGKYKVDSIWSELTSKYNGLPLVNPVQSNLTQYVTGKTLDATFGMISIKEADIRNDLSSRNTDLLKKVFGWAEAKKNKDA